MQLVAVLRQLKAPLKYTYMEQAMINMQQRIYNPPNVSGWEGGLSWLNTNTVQGRFDLVSKVQFLRYSNYYQLGNTPAPAATLNYPPDQQPADAAAWFKWAYDEVNNPWISPATKAAILTFAARRSDHASTGCEPTPALLRTPGADPRRPRRTGDVTVRCIECEEIELARVRDVRAGQTLPIPYAAMDGFPAGRSPRDLTRRKLLQWGVAGFASVYAAKELAWDQVWNAVAEAHDAPRQNALVLIYLAGGNDGLNVVMPNGYSADSTAAAQWAAYRTARPTIGRDVVAGAKIKVTPLKGVGYAPNLAFANTTVSGLDTAADTFNNDPKYGFDTLYGDGLDNSNLAVMPAVDGLNYNLSHFDNSDIWFEASYDLNNKTGWLGRWIDRNGSDSNPLQAISIDTALAKEIRTLNKPVCAISSLPMAGFKLNSSGYGGANGLDSMRCWRTGRARISVRPRAISPTCRDSRRSFRSRATCSRWRRARPMRSKRTFQKSAPGRRLQISTRWFPAATISISRIFSSAPRARSRSPPRSS